MGLFKQIAEPLVRRGVPVIPLRPKTKIAFLTKWETLATLDDNKITEWDTDFENANAACVAYARPDGIWFLEIDRPGYQKTIEEQTGHKIPETFMVRSSPGRGHFYFKQTPASIAMGNVQATDAEGKELWSARVDNRYVVAPGSYHPTSGLRYETIRDSEILPAPDWLVEWCARNRIDTGLKKTGNPDLDNEDPISEGGRNSALTSIAGKARQVMSMDREQLYAYLSDVNQKRCKPPLPESEVRTIANSVAGYAVKESGALVFGGSEPTPAPQPVITKLLPYPKFPQWVMKGTSIGDGLVMPVCKENTRYPEFMFMPGMTVMLNYLGTKVQVVGKRMIPSFYMIAIGRKGRVIKSSSVNDTFEYMNAAGLLEHASPNTRNAQGKSLVWSPGSAEGLGLEMQRTNCRNAIMFYDELKTFVDKASIDGSSLQGAVLKMYGAGDFSNAIKSRREQFSFAPYTYCSSFIACTTDENFSEHWSRMGGNSSGLDDRFFFLYQPEILSELKPYKFVNCVQAAQTTRQRVDEAIKQGTFAFTDETALEMHIEKLGNRGIDRVEKMALYFAIDEGKKEIDEVCVEKAVAIAKYEQSVKKYLATFEAETKEGALQQKLIQLLQRNSGMMSTRELYRRMHPERLGTFLWHRVYNGLLMGGWIAEGGDGGRDEGKQVILMRAPEEDE